MITVERILDPYFLAIANLFQFSTGTVGMILFIILSLALFIFIYLQSGSIFIGATLGAAPLIILGSWLGYVPFYILVLPLFLCSILFTSGDSDNFTEAQVHNEWGEYSNRIKKTYSAKFGGENPGFNDEVDKRIAVMQNCGQGFTRTIARDWLKRMERFTEAK